MSPKTAIAIILALILIFAVAFVYLISNRVDAPLAIPEPSGQVKQDEGKIDLPKTDAERQAVIEQAEEKSASIISQAASSSPEEFQEALQAATAVKQEAQQALINSMTPEELEAERAQYKAWKEYIQTMQKATTTP
ncbi:hypothetical protein COX22_00820 [Candidatus Falkowbacteria bacterium CG23_combo_of_CG06-09_8_20_14_all_49_15]|uniref:Uncharacterized protein n=1 Tax=Candidatus Falkowbacteria bacterium CG23_combo_of_CG06-09_8_20_14_all_49_15 TaxID=1974572 RepID=A0A2G9ZLP9_9BACT|nr:MAG: hypothetical protein COX22_00820 [Candidatus Falkowbacteria bacterium CG23_combo_of_CG06-09_8_20_14_all_49_15]